MDGSALDLLIGVELTQVWFVHDYLQLVFSADHTIPLQCFVWPVLRSGEGELRYGAAGYRDALCEGIGDSVLDVSAERGLRIRFTEREWVVDPALDEIVGPEIALLHTDPLTAWEVWRSGEDAFAHLRVTP